MAQSNDIYNASIEAVVKTSGITPEDRASVNKFLMETSVRSQEGSGSRWQHFHTTLSTQGFLATSKKRQREIGLIDRNLGKILDALDDFELGKPVPKNLRESAVLYIKFWQSIVYAENSLLRVIREVTRIAQKDKTLQEMIRKVP